LARWAASRASSFLIWRLVSSRSACRGLIGSTHATLLKS
jgi:hypothetical protein